MTATTTRRTYQVRYLVRNDRTHSDSVLTVNVKAGHNRDARKIAADYFRTPGQTPVHCVCVDQVTDKGLVPVFSHVFNTGRNAR